MKFNKKAWLGAGALALVAVGATPFLVSCSQGSSVNLNQGYSLKVGDDNYWVNKNGGIVKKENGKDVTFNFNPSNNYSQADADKLIKDQEEITKMNIYNGVSSYLTNIMNFYLNYLTRVPKNGSVKANDKNITDYVYKDDIAREFELAYALGLGEAKDTYRLKVNSIDFTADPSQIWSNTYKYGEDVEKDGKGNARPRTALISVSNINITFSYFKLTGSSNYSENVSLNDLKNSNASTYWKNFQWDNKKVEPTTTKFKITLSKNLFFKIKQGYKEKDGEFISTGLFSIDNPNNSNDLLSLPLVFGSDISKSNFDSELKTQNNNIKGINEALKLASDDAVKFKDWCNDSKNETAKAYPNSLISSITKA